MLFVPVAHKQEYEEIMTKHGLSRTRRCRGLQGMSHVFALYSIQ